MVPPQLREAPAKLNKPRNEGAHVVVSMTETRPIDPADFVVMAIGIVVAALAVADLVAGKHQRDAAGKKQACEKVAALPASGLDDDRIVSWPFDAKIHALIGIGSVAVMLSICFVVF